MGDQVLKEVHVLSDAAAQFSAKLAPKREGPFVKTKMLSENVALLQDPVTAETIGPVNVVQLATYHEPVIAGLEPPEPLKLDRGRPKKSHSYGLRRPKI